MATTSRQPFRAACIQFNPQLNERDANIEALLAVVIEAAENGAKLIVTPEMATTGYYYKDRAAIQPFVDTIPGRTTNCFAEVTKQYDAYLVIGMAEMDAETGIYYNSAALIGPEGVIGTYRKVHLWETEAHWAAWGEAGIPVFDTELGKIGINICMDSVYFESARLAAVQGAEILAFLTNSSGQSISTLQSRAETNGLYVVSANRSNTENGFHMVGASAIWSPDGEQVAETAFLATPEQDQDAPAILYGEIDPARYENVAKQRLRERRPELYHDLMLYVAPWDFTKESLSREVVAAALQYEPIVGNKVANLDKVRHLLTLAVAKANREQLKLDLVVLPELSLTGDVGALGKREINELADTVDSPYVREMLKLGREFGIHLVFGFVEREGDQLYNSAALVTPEGNIAGIYRKTHRTASDRRWASPGTSITTCSTESLGRIGMMIGYDAAFPEVAGVLAVNRAELIVIPSLGTSEFGRELVREQDERIGTCPSGANTAWDAIATGTQAFTIVSNFVGTRRPFSGRSALYTLDPIYEGDQPKIASGVEEEALVVQFSTAREKHWFNQEKLILSRRTNFYKSLV